MFGMDAIVRRGYAEFLHGRIAVLQVNAADVCKCRSKAIVHLHLRFDDWNGNNLHSKNERCRMHRHFGAFAVRHSQRSK